MNESEKETIEQEGGLVDESEEKIYLRPLVGWSLLGALCVWILGWSMFIMMSVADIERRWDFGQYDDTPASSTLSSSSGEFHRGRPQVPLVRHPAAKQNADSTTAKPENKKWN